ncbi:MAG TPA: sugar ABC transporter ATP-binding protein [Chthoniobacterales bacterium]
MPSLLAKDVSKTYVRTPVLKQVTLAVEPGSVHCLAGENGSGKSTLIKIIAGTLEADAGTVEIAGQDATRASALARIDLGLSVIYQDFSLLPNLAVFENISFLDSVARHRRWVNFGQFRRQAREILERMRVNIDLDAPVEELPVAKQQLVAIARALSSRSKVIIMDEPTSALTKREVRTLFQIVEGVRHDGVSFLFVSHKLEEIYEICDQVTVIRNGEIVAAGPVGQFSTAQLSEAISGRQIRVEPLQPPAPGAQVAPRFEVRDLTLEPMFREVSFNARAGEVLGLTGLLGSGRGELAISLSGQAPARSGRILLDGQPIFPRSVRDAQRLGICYVPEDRLNEGLFLEQAIFDNLLIGDLRKRTRHGLLDFGQMRADGEGYINQLRIKASDGRAPVQTLSGGNQQRVLIARYLDLAPKVLILNGPTIGVDVGSKHDIHVLIGELAKTGAAIIVVSDDLPELLSVCHRILVMAKGRLANEHPVENLELAALTREVTLEG